MLLIKTIKRTKEIKSSNKRIKKKKYYSIRLFANISRAALIETDAKHYEAFSLGLGSPLFSLMLNFFAAC